jgi:signal transduction histidine kinase
MPPNEPKERAAPMHGVDTSRLVAVIARDLINPITAMLGYIELLRGENLDEKALHYVAKLQQQTEKLQRTVTEWRDAPAAVIATQALAVQRVETIARAPLPETPATPKLDIKPARVLIVQKNESALEFQKAVLGTLPTEVVATFDGKQAIEMLGAEGENVSVVILDDELDGEWPGRKLYGWICDNRPDLRERVLLTVSSATRPDLRELIESENLAYVQKPLRTVELFDSVRQILTGKSHRHLN